LAFEPDFILVSAGFDAHERDHLHSRGETQINEFDYQWLTENLQKIANKCAQGRLVSVLEGGYNTNIGPISPLAQSVQYHVRAMLHTKTSNIEDEAILTTTEALLGKRQMPREEEDVIYEVEEQYTMQTRQ
jgi:acetoin utilization deacetylase AcuC-like enzyme